MAEPIRSYRDLSVWQKGIDLVVECYQGSDSFPKSELYGLTSQLRRAAVLGEPGGAEHRRSDHERSEHGHSDHKSDRTHRHDDGPHRGPPADSPPPPENP